MIQEVHTAVSVVLKESTSVTLHQFEDHVEIIVTEYNPYLVDFNELAPGACRDRAETMLTDTVSFSGFDGAVCASKYNEKVQTKIDIASKSLVRFDDVYSQVQSIVVKSFIGQNVYTNPDDIQKKFKDIFDLAEGKWNASRPEIESVVNDLASSIDKQNIELGRCHDKIMDDAVAQFGRFGRMVQTCNDFNNSQDSLGRTGRTSAVFEQLFEEFKAESAKLKLYEWTA